MKYLNFNLLLLTFLVSACNQPKKAEQQVDGEVERNLDTASLADSFYKRLEGTIGAKKVVMHLHKSGKEFNGSYYGDGSWLELLTDTVTGKNEVILFENNGPDYYFDRELKQPRLDLKFSGPNITGKWTSGNKDQTLALKLEEKYPAGSYTFSLNNYGDSIKAYPERKISPMANINFTYLLATNEHANSKWLNKELKKLNGINDEQDVKIALKKDADNYLKDYQAEIQLIRSAPGTWMNYSDATVQNIQFNDKDFVVINNFTENYSGGAHGSYNSTLYCFDVRNQKKMSLADVVQIDSNSLQKIVEKNLRTTYNLKPNEQLTAVLFENFLKPNNNFYFNTNGIAFMYNPYEVASYAQGQIVVFIPYADLKAYLNPVFSKRFGLD